MTQTLDIDARIADLEAAISTARREPGCSASGQETFSFPALTREQRRRNAKARRRFALYHWVGKRAGVSLACKGEVTMFAYDDDGNLLDVSETYQNVVVTVGKDLVLDRLFSLSGPPTAITSVGVGTDSTGTGAAQTKLNPSVAGTVVIQTADAGTARASETVTIQSTYGTATANFTWNEAGLFNGNVNGTSTMFNRVIIGPFTKSVAVTIVLQFQITQA